jgi:hypothetical protein
MTEISSVLSLDRPAQYQIRVPGQLDDTWSDWFTGISMATEPDARGQPVTVLVGTLDQAALHGLLRRLYAMGLPLLSVIYMEEL